MKYYTLILLLIGCGQEPLDLRNYLQSEALEGKKLLYSCRTTKHYTDTIQHSGNCIIIHRRYPKLKLADEGGTKTITVPASSMTYEMCLQSNVLYGSEGEDQDKHIILSNSDWELDGVDCKIIKRSKMTIQKLNYRTLLAACSNGSYAIHAEGLGIVESGYGYPNKIIETKLIKIEP